MNADKVARSLLSLLALWSALLVEGCGGGSSGGTANVSTYAIGGTVSGLTTGNSVVLKDNNADDLTVSANAAFTFGTAVANGGSYSVTVSMQPTGQTCLVSDGAGIVATANVTQIRVLCPSETVMWTFAPSGLYGSGNESGVIQASDGDFYGTTSSDGAYGIGTVFKVTPTGVETTLWNFGGTSNDAEEPLAGLVQGADGNFYGTTFAGGAIGGGTTFTITSAGVETVLWSFGAAGDGNNPTAKLTEASDGNFYGTTVEGGTNNLGTVYQISKAGAETVIWNFGSGNDGATPYGPLIQAADGNLYGLTQGGGSAHVGTGFKLTLAGEESVLWNFDLSTGAAPVGGLIQGSDGAFYGSTAAWGLGGGEGTVFRATTSGEVLVLWNAFTYSSGPKAGVIQGTDGALYGTTEGYSGATPGPSGIVFRVAF